MTSESDTLEDDPDFTILIERDLRLQAPLPDMEEGGPPSEWMATFGRLMLLHPQLKAYGARKAIEGLVSDIDTAMSGQLNAILHAPEYQTLEATWRGLHQLVRAADKDLGVKVKTLDIGKRELMRTLRKFPRQRLGPKPVLPQDLRGGVRPVRRRAVRPADRRLHVRPPPGRCGDAVRHRHDRGRRPCPLHHPGRTRPAADGKLVRDRQSARSHAHLQHPGIRALAGAAGPAGFPLPRPMHAALFGPAAIRRADGPARRLRVRGGCGRGGHAQPALGQCRLRLRRQCRPRLRLVRLVQQDSGHRPGRRGGGLAGAAPPHRRRRRGPAAPSPKSASANARRPSSPPAG